MRQRSALVLAALLVAAVAAIPIAGMAATGDVPAQTSDSANETSDSVAPGEQLAGVVNVQEAEIEGEVDERAYGIKIATAQTNDSKAQVVKAQLDNVKQRLADLEERKQELKQARNESMSEGRYRAEMSELAAETKTAQRLVNQSETVSEGLPADVRKANDINVTAIQTLQEQAKNLTGPEVAEIARSIAGPQVGGPPGDRGPAERPEQGGPDERPGPGGEEMPDGNTTDGNQTNGTQTPDEPATDRTESDGQRTTTETVGQQTTATRP